ncbi:MAG: C39 family peptidase [Candidatus Parcubacteria bacterium]|nr:C39 family peptidase [Candidatus Parcubacteria bacterium]
MSLMALPGSVEASVSTPTSATSSALTSVPFFSQFRDIDSPKWQKVGCGIASLAMIIDFYKPNAVSANALLKQGIAAGAYNYDAGWIYAGLIGLSRHYGLDGAYYNLTSLDSEAAYAALSQHLKSGPVIASVHYKFDPKSTIPHLVVLNGIQGDRIYYNDPAAKSGELSISKEAFLKAWKKKIIDIRPAPQGDAVALASH